MKLKYDYTVKKRKITIELETVDFTSKEIRALDMLGEPVISFQKTYPGGYTIALSKKLRSEFKARIRIDGSANVELANQAGQQFVTDIQELLEAEMEKLMDNYEDQVFPPLHNVVNISNYN